MALIDTLELAGRDFADALILFWEEDMAAATALFGSVSESLSPHATSACWFLTLIGLYNQDGQGSREYLELIRVMNPDFFNLYGRKLMKSLN
jgi:hypothetical protein